MKRVLFRAPVLTHSGYGVHARQILRYLKGLEESGRISLQVQVLPWGDTPWMIDSSEKTRLIEYAMQRTGELVAPYDVTIQLQLPNEWDSRLGFKNIGVTAGVETDICNSEWVSACDKMDTVIVPSEHTRKCIMSSGAGEALICVVPESYTDFDCVPTTSILQSVKTEFNFLIHGQLTGMNDVTDRKNIFNTIRWICDVFRSDPSVGIVLKTNVARGTKIDRKVTTSVIMKLLSEVRRGDHPRVHLVHGILSDDENNSLYTDSRVKALVSLTRGEGFGLPLLEAAVAGLPIIATGWSAHTEFLGESFTRINHRLIDVHQSKIDNNIFIKGSKWADTSEIDFKSKILKFRKDQSSEISAAKELSKRLRVSHSFISISSKYNEVIGDFLL